MGISPLSRSVPWKDRLWLALFAASWAGGTVATVFAGLSMGGELPWASWVLLGCSGAAFVSARSLPGKTTSLLIRFVATTFAPLFLFTLIASQIEKWVPPTPLGSAPQNDVALILIGLLATVYLVPTVLAFALTLCLRRHRKSGKKDLLPLHPRHSFREAMMVYAVLLAVGLSAHYLLPSPGMFGGVEDSVASDSLRQALKPYAGELTGFGLPSGVMVVCRFDNSTTNLGNYGDSRGIMAPLCRKTFTGLPVWASLTWVSSRTPFPVKDPVEWEGKWDGLLIKRNFAGVEVGRVAYRGNLLYDGTYYYFSRIDETQFLESVYGKARSWKDLDFEIAQASEVSPRRRSWNETAAQPAGEDKEDRTKEARLEPGQ